MATDAQTAANRENAQFSTGPITPEGKSTAARNALTNGLYTREPRIEPGEQEIYNHFRETLVAELTPAGALEESFAAEIVSVTWRLRRCAAAEADLYQECASDEEADRQDKTRRSIERAQSHAHNILTKAINNLRRLQTDRITRQQMGVSNPGEIVLLDARKVVENLNAHARGQLLETKNRCAIDKELASICKTGQALSAPDLNEDGIPGSVASICKTGQGIPDLPEDEALEPKMPPQAPASWPQIARNAPCPCGSGDKYKRCCGKNAPPVLGRAA